VKICPKCKIEKAEEEFHRDKYKINGRCSLCKLCRNKYSRNYYENNREDRLVHKRKYNLENREMNRIRAKLYVENNKEKVKEAYKKQRKSFIKFNIYAHQISYAESTRHDPENYDLLQVKCTYCGKWFNPTRQLVNNRIKALDGKISGEQRLYCSKECKQLCPIFGKRKYSAEETNTKQLSREVQPELRQMVFERDEWACIKCNETKALQCHHIEGIRWNPIESADIDICVTFCIKCHGEAHKDKGCRYIDMRCQ